MSVAGRSIDGRRDPETRPPPPGRDRWDPDAALPCRSADADLWFAERPDQLGRAQALCRGCPARQRCLAGALDRREPWGVWGGEIFERGRVIPFKRGRGRPAKAGGRRSRALAWGVSAGP